jgi:sugar lactone lactonase YvrE
MNPLLALLKHDKSDPPSSRPHLESVVPAAAMPGGEVEVSGANLGPHGSVLPHATIGDTFAPITLSRPTRAIVRIPEGSIPGDLILHHETDPSNPLPLRVAVPMAENLHPVANPAVDADGNVYTTVSGSRGQIVPVSIFQIQRDFQIRPHVRGMLNATSLAFGPDGLLYVSSRADGAVYRISPDGTYSTYAEGLGLATGIAFDSTGNLYVGDRSGTIFKIGPNQEIFVHATLEPSMAAYHLAFNPAGILFVTGPTTSSNQTIHTIDSDGTVSVFYQGLGRAQGMAFDVDGNLYVAASLHGQRGIVRITPQHEASLVLSGHNLVGLAFLDDGCAALATRDSLFHVDLAIEGLKLT